MSFERMHAGRQGLPPVTGVYAAREQIPAAIDGRRIVEAYIKRRLLRKFATDTSQFLTGQTLEVRLTAPANPGPPISVTADRVRLRMSQLTANVSGSPTPPTFMLGNLPLPSLFTGAGITSCRMPAASEQCRWYHRANHPLMPRR